MKAISIKQPWAWLIANGYKTVENRKWYTAHRGDLLIHASKSKEDLERDLKYVRQTFGIGIDPDQLIFGQVLAVADLIACTKEPKERIDQYWHDKGNFAWILRKIRQIDPFGVRGRLNLFEIPFSWDEYPEQIREPMPDVYEEMDEPAFSRRTCLNCVHWICETKTLDSGCWIQSLGWCETNMPGRRRCTCNDCSCDKFEAKMRVDA